MSCALNVQLYQEKKKKKKMFPPFSACVSGDVSAHLFFPLSFPFAPKHKHIKLQRMIVPLVSQESTGREGKELLYLIINLSRYFSSTNSCSLLIHCCPHIYSYSHPELLLWWVLDYGSRTQGRCGKFPQNASEEQIQLNKKEFSSFYTGVYQIRGKQYLTFIMHI